VLNVLLLIAGIGSMLFTAGFDFFKKGVSHFGLFLSRCCHQYYRFCPDRLFDDVMDAPG
jgi:hypothetical protein